jgi:hypothetical protein
MKNNTNPITTARRLATMIAVLAVFTITVSACSGMLMMHRGAKKPAADQFGLGPRTSAESRYTAVIEPAEPLKPRRMLKVNVSIVDASGRPVDGAAIEVDGGMPQHGHGLPTQPRVTKSLGDGRYEIDGLRFNMGGWWELHLAIASPAGTDRVTFNLQV